MNGTALSKNDLAAWRSLIARPDITKQLTAAAVYLISALVIPFCANESVALIFVAACAVFFYTQTHALSALLAPAIPAVLLFSLSGSMVLPAAFFAIVFGGAAGGLLIATAKEFWQAPALFLLLAAAYAAALLLGADVRVALLTLLPLPAALVAGLATRRCLPFTTAIAAIAAAIGAALLLSGGIALSSAGLLNASHIPAFLDLLTEGILTMFEKSRAIYAEAGLTVEIALSAGDVRNLLAELVNVSPAILAILSMVTAYFVWRVLTVLLVTFGALPRMPRLLVTPTMSVTAAILFSLACVVFMIADRETATLTGAVAQNIFLILEPGLALVGAGRLLRRDEARSCLSLLLLIGIVYLIWVDPAVAVTAAAFVGVAHVLITAFLAQKNRKGEP
ncbi:MAG: hypothetical protein IJW51_00070 [Clostridia bacterium]|nr:hypothetical protein [Clostridia bacterium]